MAYLEGINIAPRNANEAKKLIGKYVRFLRKCDIDKSGRGYFFPRVGQICDVKGRNLIMENSDSLYFGDIVEMIELQISE